jgi:iron complex outermembrane receptor protein
MLPAVMNGGLSAQLVGAIAGTFGLTPTQQTNIRNALNGLAPSNTQVDLLLRNVLAGNAVTPFSSVTDYSPLGANFSNTWEVGYKGVIGNKLSVAVDYWYQIRPADPTTQVINGDDVVFFNPTTLGSYLGNPATGVTAALAGNGVPAPAIGTVITNWVTSLAGLPTGTLAFNNDLYDRSYLVFTYQNADGQVDVRGIDVALDYQINPLWSVASTYSTLSRNVFTDAVGATPTNPLVANTPRHRASLTFRRASDAMSMEIRGRYADAFDVNSGVFNNYNQSVPAGGTPYTRVPVNAFMDAGFSWKLPVAQNVRWSLNIQNVLDNQVPSFIGVAPVGRFATTRVSYNF